MKSYIVVSGIPGSGKSTVAHLIAEDLGWPIFNKDDFLEALFKEHGCQDSAQRQVLSREADALFQDAAKAQDRAVLDSFWRHPKSRSTSGIPSNWLVSPDIRIMEVVCLCPAQTAAQRFLSRKRHPGHHDHLWTEESLMAQSRRLERELPLDLGVVVEHSSTDRSNLERLFTGVREWTDTK